MAINPADLYTGKVAPPSSDYPLGSARDVTAPGSGDGTPFVASLVNDTWGFYQALLEGASETASGTPETALASQYLDSLKAILQPSQFTIGSIQQSILDLSQFQALNGTDWVLMDGSDISGSALATLTGTTTAPDATGCFLRNAGGDADAIGVQQADGTAINGQAITTAFEGSYGNTWLGGAMGPTNSLTFGTGNVATGTGLLQGMLKVTDVGYNNGQGLGSYGLMKVSNTFTSTDTETRPINIAVNYFIKIN